MFERASDGVKITLIVCGSVVVLAVVGALVWLVDRGRDVTAIMTLISTLLVPLGGAALYGKLATVERQTNGSTHRLLSMLERTVPTTDNAPTTTSEHRSPDAPAAGDRPPGA